MSSECVINSTLYDHMLFSLIDWLSVVSVWICQSPMSHIDSCCNSESSLFLCVCVCVCVCVLSMLQNALKVLLCSLESCVSCSFFFVLLMLAQETFSILPQDHLGKLLSSGLKVSPHSFSSPVRSLDCCGEASGQTHSTSGIKSYSLLDCMSTLFAYYTLSPLDS